MTISKGFIFLFNKKIFDNFYKKIFDIKRQVKTLRDAPKKGFFRHIDSRPPPNAKRSTIKAFTEVS